MYKDLMEKVIKTLVQMGKFNTFNTEMKYFVLF